MATRKYQKKSHHQHILDRPDTYIGSTKTNEDARWVYDASVGKMVWRTVHFNPGLYKIFDEIIVNARDEFVRSTTTADMTPVKRIDITVENDEKGNTVISIENDGDGIPIEKNEEEKMMIPEMIFGNLLTSANYDDDEERIVGGKNGLGQKCLGRDTKIPLFTGAIKEAHEIVVGDQLIGDDGLSRTVLSVVNGRGPMFRVEQVYGESYVVNDEHILTLHMPDHKTIMWNDVHCSWMALWWDHTERRICSKKVRCEKQPSVLCLECDKPISSQIARHYRRIHADIPVPKMERKTPMINPEMTETRQKAREELEEFMKTIPDDATFDMSIKEYLALNPTTQNRLAGIRGKCVEWPRRDVVLDPYVLGLWLGDGMATGYHYACFGEKDTEIMDYLTEWGKKNDATFRLVGHCVYRITSTDNKGKKGYAPLKKQLARYGLIQNKHIPIEYLVNDRETRLAVLAGIIDTDGHVSRDGTRISISQGITHTRLANDIVYLARSLGFSCQVHTVSSQTYSINISGNGCEDIPTRLPRKKCMATKAHNTAKTTGRITITKADDDEYVGIHINGNERFLINDFTVTHNCTNIMSSYFSIDLKTPSSGKHYTQTWRDNMFVCDPPVIAPYKGAKGNVRVTFHPDKSRFVGAFTDEGMTADMIAVFHTRVVELAGLVGKDVKVSWNGAVVSSNSFEKFIKLFLRDGLSGYAYEDCGPRWEVGAILANHLYSGDEELPEDKHVSFVNGVHTKKGGKHVEVVTRKVLTDFCEFAKTKKVDIKPGQLKHAVVLFIHAIIVNPSFDSQSKEFLTTPAAEFGSRAEYNGKLITGLTKLGLLDEAKHVLEAKSLRDTKKTDGKKRSTIRGIVKLEDALLAGTAKSSECTLILTEGDSASTSAISGLKEVGRERWGVFPLRGKLLNVRDITPQKFNANEELTAIKKILGLEQGRVYKDISELRYGRVMIMADQDHDGSHIKGLLMNLFHAEWPGLMRSGFLCTLLTPILKASKGKTVLSFYSLPEFQQWKDAQPNGMSGWKVKYYKGLGTSTPAEAREWFRDLHEVGYVWDATTDESIQLAFNKKLADDRKRWLSQYNPTLMLVPVENKASYSAFVHNELIHFSNADNIRSIPHLMDGLKPSQRKILFSCLKRNLREEIRVAQLAGYVSEHAAYHHGEASLNSTIVGMAQTFVGSNNVNLLKPIGQFGCLAPNTPILMWDGTIKSAKECLVGDELIGDDGLKRTITQTTSGVDDMFDITDTHGTTLMTVNSQHILTVRMEGNFKIIWKESHSAWEFSYFNGTQIKTCSVRINASPSETDHFNRSTTTKEEGYEKIVQARDELVEKYSSSNVIDIKLADYMKLSTNAKRALFMFTNQSPIQWEKHSVPLDPYIFGAWLGDGDHMGKGFTSIDPEIIKSFVVEMKKIGAEVTHHSTSNHDGYHYSIRRKGSGRLHAVGSVENDMKTCLGCTTSSIPIPHDTCNWRCENEPNESEVNKELIARCQKKRLNPFTQVLKENDLFRNKHIPRQYIFNDVETRLQLLAGFIDTDGTLKHNTNRDWRYEISQSDRLHGHLIRDLEFVAKSLGFATSVTKTYTARVTSNGEDCSVLTLFIFGENVSDIPVRILRKQIKTKEERIHHTVHCRKFSVNPLGKGEFCGWSIDGNERFLLGNFIVTHNSRLQGGADAASPRYIHTHLEDIVGKLFRKEDAPLLKYIDDDGEAVEPEYYLPVIPMIAVNGVVGIGTGYSTDIPPYKPDDMICLLRHRLEGTLETLAGRPLDPWWFGFRGKTQRKDDQTWLTRGVYDLDDAKRTVTVTELPVGMWTKDYKAFLDGLCESDEKLQKESKKEAKKAETTSQASTSSGKGSKESKEPKEPCGLKGFDDLYNDIDVRFVLYFTEEGYDAIKDDLAGFEKRFKLTTSWKTTNMTCFDTEFRLVKYPTVGDMMESFVEKRLPMYEARRQYQMEALKRQMVELDAKRRFIQAILDEQLVIQKRSDEEIVLSLKACEIPPLSCIDKPDEYDSYDYVLRMRIDRLKQSAVIELDEAIDVKMGEIEHLESQTGASLWLSDLTELDEAWKRYAELRMAESIAVASGVAVDGKKKPVMRVKKPVMKK